MKRIIIVAVIFAIAGVFAGCKEGIDKVLVGTWNVTEVKGVFNTGGGSLPPVTDESPMGTITFRSNGTGEQNYTYSLGGTQYPQIGSFTWSATDDLIIIDRADEPDMEWERIVDKDNKQVATYNILVNANQSWDYTLTLEK